VIVGLIFSVGVAGFFAVWQDHREDLRQEHAEMLANVAYIRDVVSEGKPRDFRYLNLRNANLSGIDLGCDLATEASPPFVDEEIVTFWIEGEAATARFDAADHWLHPLDDLECADFTGSDLTGTVLDHADLTGANFSSTTFVPGSADFVKLVGADVNGRLEVSFAESDLRDARFVDLEGNGRIEVASSAVQGAVFGRINGNADLTVPPPGNLATVSTSEVAGTPWAALVSECSPGDDTHTCSNSLSGAVVVPLRGSRSHLTYAEEVKFYQGLGCDLLEEPADDIDNDGYQESDVTCPS
jgi:uncharacterized protein YjbI with pentapeptide repeats